MSGEFGSSEELADSILSGLPASEIVTSLRKQKRSYTLLIFAGILLLLLCACIAGYIINWERTDHVIRLKPRYILDGTEMSSEEFQRKKNK